MQSTKSVFGYVRVSTVKQGDGVSLEAQREAIEAYAQRNNLLIVRWFEEKVTAAKSGRPLFTAMTKLLLKGKAQGLVCHAIDRSARNLKDWALIADLSDAGIDVHFAKETLDFRSRGGRLTADIQAVIAADYIRNLREETLKGIRGRLKQGLYPLHAPLGYRDNGPGKLKTIDPVVGPEVKRIFELYGSGQHSFRTLRIEMDRRGFRTEAGRSLSKQTIERMLSNPFYIGVMRLRSTGETFPGKHEPLISSSLFNDVQAVRTGKSGKKLVKHDALYRGLFRCAECKYFLSPERQRGHVYYRCHTPRCVTKCVREEVLDAKVKDLIAGLAFSDADLVAIERNLSEFSKHEMVAHERQATHVRLSQARERLARIEDAFIDRHLDANTYHARRERELLHIRQLEEELDTLTDDHHLVDDVLEFLERAKTVAQLYATANPSEKREMVSLATSNRWVDGKDVVLEPSNWLVPAETGSGVLQSGR